MTSWPRSRPARSAWSESSGFVAGSRPRSRSPTRSSQHDLVIAERSFGERRLTEREIEQPGPDERIIEPEAADRRELGLEPRPPGAQRRGVVHADVRGSLDLQAR